MQPDSNAPQLRRVLGPVDATCIVIGAIIGVGIFFTPSQVARLAESGDMALLAWAVGGGIALLGALTFAELGGLYPNTGGQYQILRDSYGPLTGFLYVFCNATAIQAGAIAIIAVICTRHIGIAVGNEIETTTALLTLSTLIIVGLMTANIMGVRWGARIQNATVYAKVLTLLVVTGIALFVDTGGIPSETISDTPTVAPDSTRGGLGMLGVLFAAMVPAFFAFGGWQQALWVAGEVRRPQRNVPLSIVAGVIIVVIVYMLANWAYLNLLGYEGVRDSKALAADAVAVVWPGPGERIIGAAVAVSAFGVLNAQLLAGPRLIHSLARDGRFFRIFAGVNKRFGTPSEAIILLGGISLFLLIGTFLLSQDGNEAINSLLAGVVFIDGIFFVLTGLALLILRRKRPEAARPVRVPLYPVVPVLYILGHFGILVGALVTPEIMKALISAGAWIIAAIIIFFFFFRDQSRSQIISDSGGEEDSSPN